MRKILFLAICFLAAFSLSAQDFSTDKTTLANFLKRMYNSTAFEGAKIVEDYDNHYLISVLALETAKYKTQSTMFRVAQVKALSIASEFVNGSNITSNAIISTKESTDSTGTVITVSEETIERIHSVGFVQGMELLINFVPPESGQTVFIYARRIAPEKK